MKLTKLTIDDIDQDFEEYAKKQEVFVAYSQIEEFLRQFLNPEELGRAVPGHVRDEVRMALGREPVEDLKPKKKCNHPKSRIKYDQFGELNGYIGVFVCEKCGEKHMNKADFFEADEKFDLRKCPKCVSLHSCWRSGVGFDHMRRCTECGKCWDPDESREEWESKKYGRK